MPFITLELSKDIAFDFQPFALELHSSLAPRLGVPIEYMKCVLYRPDAVVIGENASSASYARLKIELKQGREHALLIACQKEILRRFSDELRRSNPALSCRVTVEFSEITPALLEATGLSG